MYRNLMLLKTFQIEKNVLIHKEREITKQYNNINWKRNFEGHHKLKTILVLHRRRFGV